MIRHLDYVVCACARVLVCVCLPFVVLRNHCSRRDIFVEHVTIVREIWKPYCSLHCILIVLQMDALNAKTLNYPFRIVNNISLYSFDLEKKKCKLKAFQIEMDSILCEQTIANECICHVILAQCPKIRAKPPS